MKGWKAGSRPRIVLLCWMRRQTRVNKGRLIMSHSRIVVAGYAATALLIGACGKPKVPTPEVPPTIADETAGPVAPADPVDVAIEMPKGPMQVMVVMDSSGSMWGQIDGRSKRDIASDAVRTLVAGHPGLGAAGLIAYGHRRKGDCKDIELMRSPGANVPLAESVDKLVPTGKTPLTAAVETAAEALHIQETPAAVILVTDGLETCDADPCAAAAALEARGIDFTVYVVGLGLSVDEGREVACIAEETGGKYIEASNADELSEALESVAGAIESGPPEAAKDTATASIDGPVSVEIGSAFNVAWEGPGTESDYIDLVPLGHDLASGEISRGYTKQEGDVPLRAPGTPGAYLLRYVWAAPQGRTVLATRPIEVTDAEVALIADPAVGIGDKLTVAWRGPGNDGDYVDIVPRGDTRTDDEKAHAYVTGRNTLVLRAPGKPGAYDLRYVALARDGRNVIRILPLEVTETKVDLAFNPSAILGETLTVDWSGPGAPGDYIDIVPRGHKRTSGEKSFAYTKGGNPLDLNLPGEAGEYDVRYVLQSSDGRTVLKSVPLTLSDRRFAVSPAQASGVIGETISVNWTGPGNDADYIDIVRRGFDRTSGEKSKAYVRTDNPLSIRLPGEPGAYDLRYVFVSSTGRSVKAVKPITVTKADVTLDTPERIDAGTHFTVNWTGPGYANDYIDVVAEGHTGTTGELSYAYAIEGQVLSLKAPDRPGTYTVRYVLQGPDGRKVVKTRPLQVD